MTRSVLIPLPRKDSDPTEVAVPWKILKTNGVQVFFATSNGEPAVCDQIVLSGKSLGPLAPLLQADKNAQNAYSEMSSSPEFSKPLKWSELVSQNFNGLILPGGHNKGMREYLESETLHQLTAQFFASQKPIGAICHGVVLAARSKNEKNGKSVLFGRKTTSLLASQELIAWALTCLWLDDYYRTYKVTVESEVKSCLASADDYLKGPLPFLRDSNSELSRGFVVQDKNYISARWPGDAHAFAHQFLKLLKD